MTDHYEELLVELTNHTLTVTLNRPDIHNAISHQAMVDELVRVCEQVNQDSEIRAMILTGAGTSFCAGGNIKDMQQKSDMFAGDPATIEAAYKAGIQRIPKALWAVEVPVVAAINGAAIGAGCDLAMMCDIRVASSTARFAESFVKLGIIPGDGGAWFLPRIIGHARASHMALTGSAIDAHTALEWGMVSELMAPEDLMSTARKIAEDIAQNPPLAVAATKKLLRECRDLELDDMLDHCANIQSHLHHSEDHKEAVNAFLEKRPGNYHGY